jgi:hypothetical protein
MLISEVVQANVLQICHAVDQGCRRQRDGRLSKTAGSFTQSDLIGPPKLGLPPLLALAKGSFRIAFEMEENF